MNAEIFGRYYFFAVLVYHEKARKDNLS